MPDITLTLTATQAARVTDAFGRYWNLSDANGVARSATAAEVKAFLVRQLKAMVLQQEQRKAESTIVVADLVVS